MAFSPDGQLLATSAGDRDRDAGGTGHSGVLRFWDAATRRMVGEPLTGHTGCVWVVAFSPDG